MAHRRDGQGHIGVRTEEGEGQKSAAQHGGRQPAPRSQGAWREKTAQRGQTDHDTRHSQERADPDRARPEPSQHERRSGRGAHRVGDPVFLARCDIGPTQTDQRRQCEGSRHGNERDEPEEDPTPTEQVAHGGRHCRSEDAGDYPGRRQHGHHPRPLRLGEAAADGHVGHGGHGARTQSLETAAYDQHPHGRSKTADQEPGREQDEAGHVGPRRAVPVRVASGQHDPDQAGQNEGGERPAVEGKTMEVTGHHGHDGDHGQSFGCDKGDGEDEPEGQGAAMRCPQAISRCRASHAGETRGKGHWYCALGGIMALVTIDVDQHLFESRTTWSDYIEPSHRAGRVGYLRRRGEAGRGSPGEEHTSPRSRFPFRSDPP